MRRLMTILGLATTLVGATGAGPALASGERGKSYFVQVFSSFGTNFTDCYTFNANGTVDFQGYGRLVYRNEELNTAKPTWQATTSGSFVLAFHGTFGGSAAQTIEANGISSDGDTFILQGVQAQCTAARSAAGKYRK